jgi:hypothetical protein
MATWRHEIFSLRTSGYRMLFKITLIIVITYSIAEVRTDVALASVFLCLYLGFFTFWSEKSTSRAWHLDHCIGEIIFQNNFVLIS